MEVTALCFRFVMLELILLRKQVHNSYTQNRTFLRITPNRLQHFDTTSVSFDCVGFVGLTHLKAVRNTQELHPACDSKRTTSSCTIDRVYSGDSGEYWCESERERSDIVNITITAGPVILDSPALPVMQGTNVILRCRSKNQSTNFGIFYKNNVPMHNSPAEEMKITNVSKSDEGFYKCHVSSIGTSPESWLSVGDTADADDNLSLCLETNQSTNPQTETDDDGASRQPVYAAVTISSTTLKCGPVILESPALPVFEGESVTEVQQLSFLLQR
ncbi:uncharacterized protein LOC113168501 isoform X6 [Anabas testudineus]|uniref:uncharacterized protein LOC113168501 isoform X6 n=1 Tax=Anabas testudineus TaxID=64144 RepID=UPI00143D6B20|nr:uncharacterized protein LOC113168501 isoform X6 [Anabas testudineus]